MHIVATTAVAIIIIANTNTNTNTTYQYYTSTTTTNHTNTNTNTNITNSIMHVLYTAVVWLPQQAVGYTYIIYIATRLVLVLIPLEHEYAPTISEQMLLIARCKQTRSTNLANSRSNVVVLNLNQYYVCIGTIASINMKY